ncbi:serine carboxypeptidase [Xylariales sp. PMI_506]|nr:serine carboxypeptidase [Xylariales sp. PMI_506]
MFVAKALVLSGLLGFAACQFPPEPEGITILKSKFHENVTISFKEPGICETTPGVRSYSGYVHLPPGTLNDGSGDPIQNYSINTFFWFFEARKDPTNAPLSIWLNGGPGSSSIMGLLQENGPCFINSDSKSTYLNPWSWNNEVNMLYLDQPVQVGFSYDVPTNGSRRVVDLGDAWGLEMESVPEDFSDGVPESNLTSHVGTFSSQKLSQTADTTAHAAHALWHFAQTWFFEFPYYKPADDRISLWAESYGGHYGPSFFRFFQEQNEKILNGSSNERGAKYIHLDTLGIVNGLIDAVIQAESYISFPYNNTYGIQIFNQSLYETMMDEWTRPGGCKEQVIRCQEALKDRDQLSFSDARRSRGNWTEICGKLEEGCGTDASELYLKDNRGWYDIAHRRTDPFPPPYMYGYLMQESVLGALGVPVNYSSSSGAVSSRFQTSFDIPHGGFLDSIAYLLDSGIKVHMMYGDRDYACNWVGGEKASLSVPYSRAGEFAEAGYAPLLTEDGFSGMTRQLGNYSFTRVFQSGHEVPAYQPAAAYAIFMRATFNRDIPTGVSPVTDDLTTVGMKDTWSIKNTPPETPEPKCYILRPGTCTSEAWEKVKTGKAVVKDWFVVDEVEDDTTISSHQTTQPAIEEL